MSSGLNGITRKLAIILILCIGLVAVLPARAQDVQTHQREACQRQDVGKGIRWSEPGVGTTAILGNVFYVPAKLVYVVLGGIVGGAAYLVSGLHTAPANRIWRSSLGGDYVLTPEMITGHEPIHFMGPYSNERH
jgi:hypothetical protein